MIAHSDMKIMNGYVIFIKLPVRESVSSDKPDPRIKANPSEKRKTGIYIATVTIRVSQKVVLKKFWASSGFFLEKRGMKEEESAHSAKILLKKKGNRIAIK